MKKTFNQISQSAGYIEDDVSVSLTVCGGSYGGGSEVLVVDQYICNSDGTSIGQTLDASYYKGTGQRNGKEREFMAFSIGNGQAHELPSEGGRDMSEQANTLNCMHDQQAVMENSNRKYIVRRLTPLECSRLQGLPDCEGNGWCDIPTKDEVTEEDIKYWRPFIDEWADMNGTATKSDGQIKKWLKSPISDSAQYRMYGNGIATPQWFYILSNVINQYEDGSCPTMASLFDGTGSFPYIWEKLGGKALWGSEVDPDAIRVSRYRIGEEDA